MSQSICEQAKTHEQHSRGCAEFLATGLESDLRDELRASWVSDAFTQLEPTPKAILISGRLCLYQWMVGVGNPAIAAQASRLIGTEHA